MSLSKKPFALTVDNVMLLDAYDDFQEAYKGFVEYLKSFDDFVQWRSDECFEKVSSLFNPLLEKYRNFFCDPGTEFAVTKSSLMPFYGYAQHMVFLIKHGELTGNRLSGFLYRFQHMAARMRIYYETELIESLGIKGNWAKMDEYFLDQISDRINSLIEERLSVGIYEPSDDAPVTKDVLHLYYNLTTTRCRLMGHEIVPAKYVGRILGRPEKAELPVHYCRTCRKYMMGITTLMVLEKRYGRFDIPTVADQDLHDFDRSRFDSYSSETLLRELGYTVRKGKMSAPERQALLVRLLKEKRITYHEMCVTIERNIRSFSGNPRFENAVWCWRNDLKFISEYVRDNM